MEYILVDIKIDKSRLVELKIPGEITSTELIELLNVIYTLNLNTPKVLHVEPLGRILGSDEILIEAGVNNGSQLSLL